MSAGEDAEARFESVGNGFDGRDSARTEILLGKVEGGEAGLLAALAIVEVVVIEAQHGGGVGQGVRVGVAALRRVALPPKREVMRRMKGTAAAGVRGQADDDGPSAFAEVTTLRRAARVLVEPRASPWSRRPCGPRGAERTRRTWSW